MKPYEELLAVTLVIIAVSVAAYLVITANLGL